MFTTVIKPSRRWSDIDLKGIWRYRDLYRMYVRRDIVTQYKQTILNLCGMSFSHCSPQ